MVDENIQQTESGKDDLDYIALNAMLGLYAINGELHLDADRQAVRQFFLQHVNPNTVFFHDLREKIDYLIENGYYAKEVFDDYDFSFVKSLYKRAYAKKIRFPSFMGADKFYKSYALKTYDKKRYLERIEDRICIVALDIARAAASKNSDSTVPAKTKEELATHFVDEMINGRYQPATPTFLNAGRKTQRENLVSCFLIRVEDSMKSIRSAISAALRLSQIGGGVALCLTNLRERTAPIRNIQGLANSVLPMMKTLDTVFAFANQGGVRDGAGAVYLNVHHPDIMAFLDCRRENADEGVRIKGLSLGVVIPDITMRLAADNADMYMFSPYDVERVYGRPFSDISIDEEYHAMVENKEIKKYKMKARDLFQEIAKIQFESGYPYIMFEGNVNRANPIAGRVSMSNLCTEILQVSKPSVLREDLSYETVGEDISCNLGSMNIAMMMQSGHKFGHSVETAIRMLTGVSNMSSNDIASITNGNNRSHSVGLGQMNLHGYLAKSRIMYGSPVAIDFTGIYFYCIAYYAVRASNLIAIERGETFAGFEESKYASGEYFDKYINKAWVPETDEVKKIFADAKIHIPTQEDWKELCESVMKHGIYNAYLQAVAPTGSISYVNNSTASIAPAAGAIEQHKGEKIGTRYYPAPFLSADNIEFYKDAYQTGPKALIDTYAAATPHVDQGLSMTLCIQEYHNGEKVTTREINRMQNYAYKKGIKTAYYMRLQQQELNGTAVQGCIACAV